MMVWWHTEPPQQRERRARRRRAWSRARRRPWRAGPAHPSRYRSPGPIRRPPPSAGRRAARRKGGGVSFLVGASVVFLACRWGQAHGANALWVGYVGAAAEAGMVGALADW